MILLEETHTSNEDQLQARGHIPGFTLAAATYDHRYGSATYVRETITNWKSVDTLVVHDISIILTKVAGINIQNIYKPPNVKWSTNTPVTLEHPTVYMGYFNSHHQSWGYSDNNENCETIYEWSSNNNLHLIYDAKEIRTFHSGRWNKGYNPDLCFITRDSEHRPLCTNRIVLSTFPRSQHRPVILNISLQVPIIFSIPKPRWNFRKGDWDNFKLQLENGIRWIPPVPKNFSLFTRLVISTAKKHIPRRFH